VLPVFQQLTYVAVKPDFLHLELVIKGTLLRR
jgi:hypothetical protein